MRLSIATRGFPRLAAALVAALSIAGCTDDPVGPPTDSPALFTLGQGVVTDRYTGEVWVRGNIAYTTTWGFRCRFGQCNQHLGCRGRCADAPQHGHRAQRIDARRRPDQRRRTASHRRHRAEPRLHHDLQPGRSRAIRSSSRATPPRSRIRACTPRKFSASTEGSTRSSRSIPSSTSPARLVIVDITDPAAPTQAFTAVMGAPFVHDVFVRDGILFTALWNQGIAIWDIGGAGSGSVSSPMLLGSLSTVDGQAHNIWWYHSQVTGQKRYAFVGEEGPGAIGSQSSGDIHVVDVSNFAAPREVAFFHLEGAGTHNFSVDEFRGILYAALLQRRRESDRYHRRPVELRCRRQGPEVRPLRPPQNGSRARPWTRD